MDGQMSKPRRLAESTENSLVSDPQKMRALVEHRRDQARKSVEPAATKDLVASVLVQLWVDQDGIESLTVMGAEGASTLELKGLLHDGLYALAHQGEQGYVPSQ